MFTLQVFELLSGDKFGIGPLTLKSFEEFLAKYLVESH